MLKTALIGMTKNVRTEKDNGFFCGIEYEDYRISVNAKENDEIYFGAEFSMADRQNNQYIFIPGAVYDGNRFRVKKSKYPPYYEKKNKEQEIIISDVPRLDYNEDRPSLCITTADCTVPMVGVWDKIEKKAYLIYTTQGTEIGDSGLSIYQNKEENRLCIQITAPYMRKEKYRHMQMVMADDLPFVVQNVCQIVLHIRLFSLCCESMEEFFSYFLKTRKCMTNHVSNENIMPASMTFSICENKFNSKNYCVRHGFYTAGVIEGETAVWRLGWGSGGIVSYVFLLDRNKFSIDRAMKSIDFLVNSQEQSGFFPGNCVVDEEGDLHWKADVGEAFYTSDSVLIRRNADALYYLIKTKIHLDSQNIENPQLTNAIHKLCDAFVKLYEENGQLGHFVNIKTGEITIGNSCSASIVCAGLALCGFIWGKTKCIEVAEKIGAYYFETFLNKGYTVGGPGEALMCPDSESAYGLVESFVTLYEVTQKELWLSRARFAANMFSSWCVSYDYEYRKDCEFKRRAVKTTGSVWANIQNKHSAPGICTNSGLALLKLYRYTFDEKYLHLYEDISHNIVQYLSTKQRPVKLRDGRVLPEGYMCERVNISDWEGEGMVGEIFWGSNWCELSLMFSCVELPGVYVDLKNKRIACSDHMVCVLKDNYLLIKNDTEYDAFVTIFIDTADSLKKEMPPVSDYLRIEIKKGEESRINI